MKTIVTLVLGAIMSNAALAEDGKLPMFPQVEIKTSQGTFVVELDGRRAPISVQNFVKYVQDGFYDGTVFHRVISGFVAQAGGFDENLQEKETRDPIPNESGNGLSNVRGTIAMARMGAPHTGTAQFYINLASNRNLDPTSSRWGYCVFGQVTDGMDTLDKIAAIPTTARKPFRSDFPETVVTIESARLIKETPPASQ
ncbi:MAG: peptidylprolyl isomerase [Gammaproteobacteria bacterium]|nr:peptidylprolyl isomerase [Gammaproteobacteria bacterium]MDH3768803.1 peptidylprolyl isomerase [Gammaproteobacteria bacterium]